MKHLLFCMLFGLAAVFSPRDVRAAEAADTIVAAPTTESVVDISETTVEPTAPLAASRIESLLESLDQRLGTVEQRLQRIEHTPRQESDPYFKAEYLMVSLIIFMSCTTVVLIVFLILRHGYRKRNLRYELDRLAIEHGCYPETQGKDEMPLTRFLRRLLITGIVSFGILAWIGIVNLSYLSSFSILLLWGLIGGVGYAVVYLFRLYVQRREENR